MSQLFPKSSNKSVLLTIWGVLASIIGVITIGMLYVRSPIMTQQGIEKDQPVAFSHKIHAGDLKMDCRYCHTTVENSAYANIPDSNTCMKCHSVIKKESPLLAPIRESVNIDQPVEWIRIHDLPDHVYFNHSIHIAKGISCQKCHGDIQEMDIVSRKNTLQMQWCIQCHKDPHDNVRPADQVTNMWYEDIEKTNNEKKIGNIAIEQGHDLAVYQAYLDQIRGGSYDTRDSLPQRVRKQIHCSACHR